MFETKRSNWPRSRSWREMDGGWQTRSRTMGGVVVAVVDEAELLQMVPEVAKSKQDALANQGFSTMKIIFSMSLLLSRPAVTSTRPPLSWTSV